jgi:hypothetical protein
MVKYQIDKQRLEDELKQARMKSFSDVSNRDKAKLSYKPTQQAAKKSATAKKDGSADVDNDYMLIVNKGASRETLLELATVCEKKDKQISILESNAKKSVLET